jgi:hypothetical protein
MLRVDTANRSLVFSGDTGWHDELPEKVGDVDLFISECVFFEAEFEFHLSHHRLDRERSRFRCGAIRLTHLGSQVLENESRVRFDTAHDGLKVAFSVEPARGRTARRALARARNANRRGRCARAQRGAAERAIRKASGGQSVPRQTRARAGRAGRFEAGRCSRSAEHREGDRLERAARHAVRVRGLEARRREPPRRPSTSAALRTPPPYTIQRRPGSGRTPRAARCSRP